MMRFSFKKGLVFTEINLRWTLIRRLVTGKLQFESDLGEIKNLADAEVLKLWQSGTWQVDIESVGGAGDVLFLTTPADLAVYPIKWQKTAKRRMEYINAVNPAEYAYNKAGWTKVIKQKALELNDLKPPCAESVRMWAKRFLKTKSINSLLPQMRTGQSRKADERYAIFEEVINTSYLTNLKLPIKEIVERVQRRVTLLNAGRPPENAIQKIGQSTIYRWISRLRVDISEAAILGANVARNKHRVAYKHLKVEAVLERCEMDHTPLDIIVIDSMTKLPLGRPWLTLMIDVKSRLIIGFYISFNTPSAFAVLQCLKQAILAKESLLEKYPDIQNEWPAFGIPELIALDNGMDFHSEALKSTCFELGVEILFCPAATPWTKPHIERVFRTLAEGLIHRLPGTTFSNIIERGDYPSEQEAVIDIDTLTHLILKWIVDIYNVTPHKGLHGHTPLLTWKENIQSKIVELPVHARQIEVMAGIPAERTIFHYGIELDGLHYNSKQLQEIRKISGVNQKVQLKFYEDHVAYIEVFDPFLKEYLRVEATQDEYVTGLHRATHRLARAQARKLYGDGFSTNQLIEARLEIETIVKNAMKSKKMAHRKSAAQIFKHDSASILNGDFLSTFKSKGITPSQPEPLDSGLEDTLPAISNIISTINLEDLT